MSTFTVPVVTVKTVTKHPNADALDILSFEEVAWQCVEKRDLRKPGDLVVYVPIDSSVDTNLPEFSFLRPRAKSDGRARVRTIRLRGEISQGLVITAPDPSTVVSWVTTQPEDQQASLVDEFTTNNNLALYFGIKKYEPPAEPLPPLMAGNFPEWCEKSDAERYQNFNRSIQPYEAENFYHTLKMDGTSITVFFDKTRENPIGVCSRNWELKEFDEGANKWTSPEGRPTGTNIYWEAARAARLIEIVESIAAVKGYTKFAIQGELCGPGIQGNKMGLTEKQFFAFDMYNGDAADFLPYSEFLSLCETEGIQHVQVLHYGNIVNEVAQKFDYIKKLTYANGAPAEGIVFVAEQNKRVGTLGRLKFKFINPEFLLKYE